MIHIDNPQNCCGCTACASICSRNAISMVPDALGFLYPKVDEPNCIDCGLCNTVCQFNNNYDKSFNLPQPIAYAARHKDLSEIMKSRSGAAFVAISDYVFEQGGVVYGAGYKEHFCVVHKRATTKLERDEFRGSKYVQSDLTDVFRQVKKDLLSGLLVLFSGTPCQTSGLHSYVGNVLRKNLILVDVVCHGVPSPFIWRDYIRYIERKHRDVISIVNFRDKEAFGWKAHHESFKFVKGGSEYRIKTFSFLFNKNIMFRHSCEICHFANLKRPSDITLADFWGWDNIVPEFNKDNLGINLLLINTAKGRVIFDKVNNELETIQVPLNSALQPNLQHPSVIPPERIQFEQFYAKKGFDKTMKLYGDNGHFRGIFRRAIRKIRSLLSL